MCANVGEHQTDFERRLELKATIKDDLTNRITLESIEFFD